MLRLKQRLGFAVRGEEEAVIVFQANALNSVLPTLLVVPMDPAVSLYAGNPLAVLVSGAEAGSKVDHVAVATQLRPVRSDALAPGAVGRLTPSTLTMLETAVRLVLDL